ncbi:hypothetical protein BDR04DRAFT_129914 [Suillus decipiens]|nr:hypothetical protein BDR04DRAFT_129914 [Suillus decipiens]
MYTESHATFLLHCRRQPILSWSLSLQQLRHLCQPFSPFLSLILNLPFSTLIFDSRYSARLYSFISPPHSIFVLLFLSVPLYPVKRDATSFLVFT